MKTTLITTIFFLFYLNLNSQTSQSIDYVAGLEVSDRLVITSKFENEIPKMNWRFGSNFNQRINQSTFFKTGLRIASIGFQYKPLTNINFPGNPPTDLTKLQLKFDFLFFELPLIIRKEYGAKEWTPFLELGIIPNHECPK